MLYKFKDHYQKWGYRFNPFVKLTEDEFITAFPPDCETERFLTGEFNTLQIVGGQGYGKTSLLKQICCFLKKKNESFIYRRVSGPFDIPDFAVSEKKWIILDEAQNIEKSFLLLQIKEVSDSVFKIILGSHIDHESWFDRFHLLKTVYLSNNFAERLQTAITRRLEFAALKSPRHCFGNDSIIELEKSSQFSMEKARAIGFELFLDRKLPRKIDSKNIKEVARNMVLFENI